MAFPFGGQPTLADYMCWIRDNGGFCQSGYRADRRGKAHPLVKIVSKDGKHVVVTGLDQRERLVATYVAQLDRRLGVHSPWRNLPE